jgi:hypothetical protein
VAKAQAWPAVRDRVAALGYRATPLGTPFDGRVMFEVERSARP